MHNSVVVHLDDDDDDIDLLRQAMALKNHHRLVSFKRGDELLQYLKESYSFTCLIVLDINLPVGDGVEVLKSIKQNRSLASIPVVMLSSGGNAPQIKALTTYGVAVITKPMVFEQLEDIADQLLALCKDQQ